MAKDRTAKSGKAGAPQTADPGADPGGDPGADTEMFRAFVERSQTYETKAPSKGPLIVALVALLIAIAAFVLILGTQ